MNRKPGDWNCRSCRHLNFSRRGSCQRCGDPMSGGSDHADHAGFSGARGFTGSDVRPGDWYCSSCGYHNFASRWSCFKCGAFKEYSAVSGGGFDCDVRHWRGWFGLGVGGGRAPWKSGDWICGRSGCNEHNFARRTECFRCSAPRE